MCLFLSSGTPTLRKVGGIGERPRVQCLIFSTMHVSGEQLAQLTGVAAILRFPMPEIEDEEEEEPDPEAGKLDEAAGGVS